MRTRREKGFTLIELLLVILIITGLAAIVVPNYMKVSDQSDTAVNKANEESIRAAARLMVLDGGLTAVSAVSNLNTNSGAINFASHTAVYVHGPYLESIPITSAAGTAYLVSLNSSTGAIGISPVH
ncbi:MAG: prepilin-type N-terminal cleavage/methylation domain-containing protein [Deltaproteobacteria bacterium]|nr:prepilin-type N-terminal cleavage/methylation domain-containing protein [Deltaproteobacteria bacterium]